MAKSRGSEVHAVEMMRDIRDDLSRKLMGMSHEEQSRYISEQLEHGASQELKEYRKRPAI